MRRPSGIAQGGARPRGAYVKERRQFGKAIAEFQGIQFMLADMAMTLEAARQLVYVAAAKSRARRRRPDLLRGGGQVLRLGRCDADDDRRRPAAGRRRLHQGLPAERMMRDAKITQIYEGTNQIQRLVMARELLR